MLLQSLNFQEFSFFALVLTDLAGESVSREALPADAIVGAVGVLALGGGVAVVHVQLAFVLVLAPVLNPRPR